MSKNTVSNATTNTAGADKNTSAIKTPVYLNDVGVICAAGNSGKEVFTRVLQGDNNCLSINREFIAETDLPLGVVTAPLPSLATFPSQDQTRCNQLLLAALQQILPSFEQARSQIDPLRIGIVIGTSTSGIGEGEAAVKQAQAQGLPTAGFSYLQQEMSSPARFLANHLGIQGPSYVISTACSSGAKALASARRLLRMNLCDLVIAGGADALCGLTVNGFDALDSVSREVCQPFSQSRNGINIGEGAALFILSRKPGPVALAGVGEGSDAYHFSAPEPSGAGAKAVMTGALNDAGITAEQINYINLHGTATRQNDKMESLAVADVLGCQVPCSSTKPYTGHCLGAAGAIEAAICWLSMTQAGHASAPTLSPSLPLHLWDGQRDPELAAINLVSAECHIENLNFMMSNSFAFGGNNIALVFEKIQRSIQ